MRSPESDWEIEIVNDRFQLECLLLIQARQIYILRSMTEGKATGEFLIQVELIIGYRVSRIELTVVISFILDENERFV